MKHLYLLLLVAALFMQRAHAQCDVDENYILLQLDFTEANYPNEIGWALYDDDVLIASESSGAYNNGFYEEIMACLPSASDYRLELYGDFADSWRDAYFSLKMDGVEISSGQVNPDNSETMLIVEFVTGQFPTYDCETPLAYTVLGSNVSINTTVSEPYFTDTDCDNNNFISGNQVVVRWEAPYSLTYNASLEQENPIVDGASMQLFDDCPGSGNCLGLSFKPLGLEANGLSYEFSANQGEIIYFLLSSNALGSESITGSFSIDFIAPENDQPTDPLPIPQLSEEQAEVYYVLGSTASGLSSSICSDTEDLKDLWFIFEATADHAAINLSGSKQLRYAVYDENMTEEYYCVNEGNKPAVLEGLTIGANYILRVMPSSAFNNFQFNDFINLAVYEVNISNDDCDTALPIIADGDLQNVSFSGAPLQTNSLDANEYKTTWYTFENIKNNPTLQFYQGVNGANYIVEVYEGSCGGLVLVDAVESGFGANINYTLASVSIGETYYLKASLAETDLEVAEYNPSINVLGGFYNAPDNDTCEEAIQLTAGTTINGTFKGATVAADPIAVPGYVTADRQTIWYSFESSGEAFSITLEDDYYNPVIVSIYEGICGNLVNEQFIDRTNNFSSERIFVAYENISPATNYIIRLVPLTLGADHDFTIVVEEETQINDDCATARSLPMEGEFLDTSNYFATNSGFEPQDCGSFLDGDVWFQTNASAAGLVGFEIERIDNFRFTAQLFSGNCGNLTPIGCMIDMTSDFAIGAAGLNPDEEVYLVLFEEENLRRSRFRIRAATPPVPNRVTGLSLQSASLDEIAVNWNPINGADDYELFISDDNFVSTSSFVSSNNFYNFDDLLPGIQYRIFVKSRNAFGVSVQNSDTLIVRTSFNTIASVASGDWQDPNTWEGGEIPTAADQAEITHAVEINGTSVEVGQIFISDVNDETASLTLHNGAGLHVFENLILSNQANFVANQTTVGIYFSGDGNELHIGGNLELTDIFQDAGEERHPVRISTSGATNSLINIAGDIVYNKSADNNSALPLRDIELIDASVNVTGTLYLNTNIDNNDKLYAYFENSVLTIEQNIIFNAYNENNIQFEFTGGELILKGDFERNQRYGVVDFLSGALLSLEGSSFQTIPSTSFYQGESASYSRLRLNNSTTFQSNVFLELGSGATDELHITEELILERGVVLFNSSVESDGFLVMAPGAVISGGNEESYIVGKVFYNLDVGTPYHLPLGGRKPNAGTGIDFAYFPMSIELTGSGLSSVQMVSRYGYEESDGGQDGGQDGEMDFFENLPLIEGVTRYMSDVMWLSSVSTELVGGEDLNFTFTLGLTNPEALGIDDFEFLTVMHYPQPINLGNASFSNTENHISSQTPVTITLGSETAMTVGLASTSESLNMFGAVPKIENLSSINVQNGDIFSISVSNYAASTNDFIYFDGLNQSTFSTNTNQYSITKPALVSPAIIDLALSQTRFVSTLSQMRAYSNASVNLAGGNVYNETAYSFDLPLVNDHRWWMMKTADMNSDGYMDIVFAHPEYGSLLIFINETDGSYTMVEEYLGDGFIGVTSFDLRDATGSGYVDVALVLDQEFGEYPVVQLLENFGLSFSVRFTTDNAYTQYTSVLLDDVTNNGKVDLVLSHASDLNIEIFEGVGSNPSSSDNYYFNYYNYTGLGELKSLDFLNLKTRQTAVLLPDEGRLAVIKRGSGYSNGVEIFSHTSPRNKQVEGLKQADLLADGKNGLIMLNKTDNRLEYGLSNAFGNGFVMRNINLPLPDVSAYELADFNGDGFVDIIIWRESSNEITIMLNDQNGNFASSQSIDIGVQPLSIRPLSMLNVGQTDLAILTSNGAFMVIPAMIEVDIIAPTALSASNLTPTSFQLNWEDAPVFDYYEVDVALDNGFTNLVDIDFGEVSIQPLQLDLPEYSANYFVRMRTESTEFGTSPNSAVLSVKLPTSAIATADSLALGSLYEQTNGTGWTNIAGWTNGKLNQRYGLTMNLDTLKSINLSNNNLTGELNGGTIEDLNHVESMDLSNNNMSGEFFNLTAASLQNLDISNNNLTAIGIFSGLEFLNVSGNRLDFEQLENASAVTNLVFAPQQNIEIASDTVLMAGTDFMISVPVGGSANQYQWYKDGEPIAGANSATLSLDDVQFENSGIYRLEISSSLSIFEGFNISTSSIQITVNSLLNDEAALRALYSSTAGDNWVSSWDIDNGDITTWGAGSSIIIENNRVVEVNLADNNLVGAVPEEINEMLGLQRLDLSGNSISALPDITLSQITRLALDGNMLEFNSIVPNIDISGFTYENQATVLINDTESITETISVGDDFTLVIDVAGEGNTYQWYLDGEVIEDAVEPLYHISNADFAKMGIYEVAVGNEIVKASNPDFRLNSSRLTVLVSTSVIGNVQDRNANNVNAGRVRLFKIQEGAYDTVRFGVDNFVALQNGGRFTMDNVILGDYILLARPDASTYPDLLPTYWPNTIDWQTAGIVQVRVSAQEITVTLDGSPTGTSGGAAILGLLEEEFDEEDSRIMRRGVVQGAGVSVRTTGAVFKALQTERNLVQDETLIAYIQTDENGNFRFPNLPAGVYRLQIDIPGVPMNQSSELEYELRGVQGEELQVSALIKDGQIEVERVRYLANNKLIAQNNLKLYPNPAKDQVTLNLEEAYFETAKVHFVTAQGKLVKSNELTYGLLQNQTMQLDIKDLQSGFYIVQLIAKDTDGTTVIRSAGFVKY